MHPSIPITHAFLWFLCFSFSFLSFSSLFYLYFLSWFSPTPTPLFHYSQLLHFILSVMTRFTIFTPQPLLAHCRHPSKTIHWPAGCPATTITLCWLHHTSFLNKNRLSCLLPLFVFTTLIWIRVKPHPHLPLWHASSGSNSYLLLLGEMSSQQDISPQRSLSRNSKIDFFFLPIAKPHPLIPLTRGPPFMYWLGTSRWCLGPVCMPHFHLNPLLF